MEEFRRAGFSVARPGGWDPVELIKDMAQDGVSGEVLYPSLGLGFFCVEDPVFQESLFRTYNDWLIQYCKGAPDRLFGVALISAFDVDHTIAEMERCKRQGMVGTLIWQVRCSGANSPAQPLLVIPAEAGIQGWWRGATAAFPRSTPPGFPLSRE